MAINQFQGFRPGIEGVSQALDALATVHKMKQADLANELVKQQIASGQAQAEMLGKQRDVNSEESKQAQQYESVLLDALSNVKGADPKKIEGLRGAIPGMSAYQIANNPSQSALMDLYKEQLKGDAMASRNGPRIVSNAMSAGKDYDSQMQPFVQVNNDVRKVNSIFNTKDKNGNPLITPQQLGDANLAISRLYSPSHQSDSTMSQTEYESAPAKFAEAVQKLSADPTDIGSRALVEHIVDQAHHLANVSNQNAMTQLQNVHGGYMSINDPQIQKTAQAKYGQYSKLFGQQYSTMGSGGASSAQDQQSSNQQPPKQDPDAVQYSQMHKLPYDQAAAIITKRKAALSAGNTASNQ